MSEETLDGGPAHGPGEEPLEGMEYVKAHFVGMGYDSLEAAPAIGDELTFTVKARCRGVGDEEMKTGAIRTVAKFEVLSTVLAAPKGDDE